ncbi:ABC transporter ATP-binding protein [Halorientalis pallida]|uniref:ABC transporter ATP-binding protein n=1 Tax=Halorientalis pallida TaxID=2479928 RepID=UPI003C7003DB
MIPDREKLSAVRDAALFRPKIGVAIVGLSFLTALLEGIGVGFLLPIIEFTQSSSAPTEADGLLGAFVDVYAFVGVPFTLETLIAGVALVMTLRFTASFFTGWLRAMLNTGYQRELRRQLFDALSNAPIDYIDEVGTDDLLNSLVTEATRAGTAVTVVVRIVDSVLRGVVYLVLAAVLSPLLTLVALVGLGASTLFVRYVLEPAYTVGDDVAEVNSRLQTISQTALQGARDARLYNMRDRLVDQMHDALDDYFAFGVRLERNQAAMSNLNQFTNAMVVFGLVYVGFSYTALSTGEIGVFLFAVFRLSPTITQVNDMLYSLDGMLPHLVRVRQRIEDLEATAAPASSGDQPVDRVDRVTFEDVSFAYDEDEPVLRDISFSVERGEHIAFVGQSGAGKSTIVSLLGRLQDPDAGRIYADGTPIDELDANQWRERLAVVRQDPFIFDQTLRENVTVGNRNATATEVERACEIAQVTEFLDELPEGYDTLVGEDGVRLSGGQKQRVAIARALLKDADVLVLDEATSDLDSNIEQDVHTGIGGTDDEYATISIAHRLSTVSEADRIYTLVDGRVTEVGTHQELIDSGGLYADLYASQS